VSVAYDYEAVPDYETCRWCRHEWHGLPCGESACTCESAHTCRDDSWRPLLGGTFAEKTLQIMQDTGVDGWVARSAAGVGSGVLGRPAPITLRRILYGTHRRHR
jgi:hypothetical protein